MAKVSMTTNVNAAPDQLWKLIGGFNALPDWHPAVERSELEQEGQVRRLSLAGGGTLVERLETVDDGVMAGLHTSIAYDAAGVLHIAATSFDGLTLWTLDDGTWVGEEASPVERGRLDLAFDASDLPHVCIHSESVTLLYHVYQEADGSWVRESVDGAGQGQAGLSQLRRLLADLSVDRGGAREIAAVSRPIGLDQR